MNESDEVELSERYDRGALGEVLPPPGPLVIPEIPKVDRRGEGRVPRATQCASIPSAGMYPHPLHYHYHIQLGDGFSRESTLGYS